MSAQFRPNRVRPRSPLTAAVTILVAAFVLFAGLASAAAAAPWEPKIVGGSPASQQWPSYAYLLIKKPDGNTGLCGGTLVAADSILTAAHCVDTPGQQASEIGVFLDKVNITDPTPPEKKRTGASVSIHPGWNPETNVNDVAVIKLNAPAIQVPMGLAGAGDDALWEPGTSATIMGHGTTSEGGDVSDALLQAKVPIVDDSTCAAPESYGESLIASLMLCAGFAEGGVDTCQGDSGGPLLVPYGSTYKLAGVVSFGEGCAQPNKYGVYSRVAGTPLRGWVRDQIDTLNVGLQNPSFEQALDPATNWEAVRYSDGGAPEPGTCSDDQRGVCVVGADTFTDADSGTTYTVNPLDGTKMLRLGGPFTSAEQDQSLDRYVVRQTFKVDAANPVLRVNYNAFLYDYSGFDELNIRLSVVDEDGETLFSKTQGGFGSGTDLKNTGWVGNIIDLTGYEGQTVRLRLDSGGTSDNLYGFWAYLDAGEAPEPPVGDPVVSSETLTAPDGSTVPIHVQQNESGQTLFQVANSDVAKFTEAGKCLPITLSVPIGAGNGTISNPTLVLKADSGSNQTITLEDPDANGVFTYAAKPGSDPPVPQELCAQAGSLFVEYNLTEEGQTQHFIVPIGGIDLIDPQGVVYDRVKFEAKLAELGASKDCDEAASAECAKQKTDARAAAALSEATVILQRKNSSGAFVKVLSGDPGISPNVNPQITNASGLYQWDVSAGDYRVVVSRKGYNGVTSKTVTIPPPVLDLHIGMERAIPKAGFDVAPATVESGYEMKFTSTSTHPEGAEAIKSLKWDLNDDGKYDDAEGSTAKTTFTTPGEKKVALQVTDDDGDIDVLAKTVTVEPRKVPTAGFDAAPETVETGHEMTFTSTTTHPNGAEAVKSLKWDLDGDGEYDDAEGSTAKTTFTTPGEKTVGLQATDDDGDTEAITKTVTVEPRSTPAASFEAPASVEAGQEVSLASTTTHPKGAAAIASLKWDLDADGAFDDAVGNVAKATFASPGDKRIALEATDDDGDVSVATRTVTVREKPAPPQPQQPQGGVLGETDKPVAPTTPKAACDGLTDAALLKCQIQEKRKAAVEACAKLSGTSKAAKRKKAACVRKAQLAEKKALALLKCASVTNKKKKSKCIAKAKAIGKAKKKSGGKK